MFHSVSNCSVCLRSVQIVRRGLYLTPVVTGADGNKKTKTNAINI